jgi:DNA-binding response OmpR family regulator
MSRLDGRPLILVVDDDADTCALLTTCLAGHGYDTRAATSGAEALAIVAREPVTLLLLDIVMPGMDGFAVCAALRRTPAGRRLPILLVTGHDDLAMRRRGMRLGVSEFLTKPVELDDLLERVRAQLRMVELTRSLDRVERLLDGRLAALTGR